MPHRQRGSIFKAKERLPDGTVRESPNYSIKYRLPDGRQKKECIGPSKKQATGVLQERLKALYDGTYTEVTAISFDAYARKWIAGQGSLKPSTLHGYEAALGVYQVERPAAQQTGRRRRGGRAHQLVPYFGARPLHNLTVGEVNTYLAHAAVQALKPKTRRNLLVLLTKMLSDAVEHGHLGRNPLVRSRSLQRPVAVHADDETEIDVLTPGEINRLLDALPPEYYPVFLAAACTGVRLGELLGLQWGDLDWAAQRLHVRRSTYRDHFYVPKSKRSRRAVDLGDQLVAVLSRLQRDRYGDQPAPADALLFPGPTGGPLDPDNLRHRVWAPALAKAGLRHVRIHSLRHTFASLLIAQGEDLKYVSSQLGHASITITVDRYGHLLPGQKRQAAARLERQLAAGTRPVPIGATSAYTKPHGATATVALSGGES
jgi:integrase